LNRGRMAPRLDGPAAIFGSLPTRHWPARGSETPIRGHGHPGNRPLHLGAGPAILRGQRHRERAGITDATVMAMIVRGLIQGDAANRLALTEQGRAALTALIGR
jgi:hypothetical protein